MKNEWLDKCIELSRTPADLYIADRKILRRRSITFNDTDCDITLASIGYGNNKMALLRKNYLNTESRDTALMLWDARRMMGKYGSVSFTTFNHYVKGAGTSNGEIVGDRGIGSMFGPCIQSVAITYLTKRTAAVDIFYRTTEFFRKFPADLVFLREVLLDGFELTDFNITFHFANITMHPMYFVSPITMLKDPVDSLEYIREVDPYFHGKLVKWTARYLLGAKLESIIKFAQAMRQRKHFLELATDTDELKEYLRECLAITISRKQSSSLKARSLTPR